MLIHIQILRFLAAAGVVAFHAWGVAPNYIHVPAETWSFGLGHAGHGVDLFFVISGFIIFYATRRANLTPLAFLRRRIERIVPLYYFVTFAVIALAFALPALFYTPDWLTPRHIAKSLAFISFTDGEMPIVYLGWSLEYEMYFYLAVALLMAISRNVWRDVTVIFAVLVMIGKFPGAQAALGTCAFFTDPMLLEFTLGVLAGRLFTGDRVGAPEWIATGSAFAALLLAEPDSRAIVYGLPCAALVIAAAWISRVRTNPSSAELWLERLGDASYSIYLAQVNTVSLVCQYTAEAFPGSSPIALVAMTTAISVALGVLLNILVERPLLRFARHLRTSRAPLPVATPAE
jgi:exopolysaccharide production protein ExoZ